jgi:transposase InsO family protein
MLTTLAREGIATAYIDPGKPWQNGVGESLHSRFRDECLIQGAFFTVHEAAVPIEQYRRTYNQARPHSSLRNHTPAEVGTRRARPHREERSRHAVLDTRGCHIILVRRTGASQAGSHP